MGVIPMGVATDRPHRSSRGRNATLVRRDKLSAEHNLPSAYVCCGGLPVEPHLPSEYVCRDKLSAEHNLPSPSWPGVSRPPAHRSLSNVRGRLDSLRVGGRDTPGHDERETGHDVRVKYHASIAYPDAHGAASRNDGPRPMRLGATSLAGGRY